MITTAFPLPSLSLSVLVARASVAARSASLLIITVFAPAAVVAQSLVWVHQFDGVSRGVAVDPGGNSMIANNTILAGIRVSNVRKIDPLGTVLWTSLISESDDVIIHDVATDSAGRVGVAGLIGSGVTADVFVRIYDSNGLQLWSDTFGDAGANDEARGVAFDATGNVFLAGHTSGVLPGAVPFGGSDGFVRKYDSSGLVQWTRQLGTSGTDQIFGVATDSANNVAVTGRTGGDLAGALIGVDFDGFVRKYDPSGAPVWTQQFGSAGDRTEGVSVAVTIGDDVLVGGRVNFLIDQFVSKYDSAGVLLWTGSVTPIPFEPDVAVAGDADGDAYLAGMTFLGNALGPDIVGGEVDSDDAYVQKRRAADGTLDWSVRLSGHVDDPAQFSFDKSNAIATFGAGNVYLSGETAGSFRGFGSGRGFLARLAADVAASDVVNDVIAAPDDAFKSAGAQGAILKLLNDIAQAIASGNSARAMDKLTTLRSRLDGCEDGPPADRNDWIVDCAVQDIIRTLIDSIIAELS
jgi:hypothetical protein